MNTPLVQYSKFISLVLRHQPEVAGIQLDEDGWADVEQLIDGGRRKGYPFTFELLIEIVDTNDKKRFAFNDNCTKIRANQGHSRKVNLGLIPKQPPVELFHGTATRFWPSIQEKGLIKGSRHHVHLSSDLKTAGKVGLRHGKLLVLRIDSGQMCKDGFTFYLSQNNVWLTDHVPMTYLSIYKHTDFLL